MSSQVVVFGSLTHRWMIPSDLMDHIKEHFPAVAPGSPRADARVQPDFSIPFRDCVTEFFCTSNTNFEFVITYQHVNSRQGRQQERVVAATQSLVSACETVLEGLALTLRHPYTRRKPHLKFCNVKDSDSNSAMLERDMESPLRSPGGRLSMGLAVFWVLVACCLTWWQVRLRQSTDVRSANILAIGLSLGVAAVTTPVPIFANWREWKRGPSWRYKGDVR